MAGVEVEKFLLPGARELPPHKKPGGQKPGERPQLSRQLVKGEPCPQLPGSELLLRNELAGRNTRLRSHSSAIYRIETQDKRLRACLFLPKRASSPAHKDETGSQFPVESLVFEPATNGYPHRETNAHMNPSVQMGSSRGGWLPDAVQWVAEILKEIDRR
jgi:hypothetical protein